MEKARWHGLQIAIASRANHFEPMAKPDQEGWPSATPETNGIVSPTGIEVRLQHKELSTALILSRAEISKTLWQTDLENCGALSQSPDKLFVAFICETNGVFVMDIDQAIANSSR